MVYFLFMVVLLHNENLTAVDMLLAMHLGVDDLLKCVFSCSLYLHIVPG